MSKRKNKNKNSIFMQIIKYVLPSFIVLCVFALVSVKKYGNSSSLWGMGGFLILFVIAAITIIIIGCCRAKKCIEEHYKGDTSSAGNVEATLVRIVIIYVVGLLISYGLFILLNIQDDFGFIVYVMFIILMSLVIIPILRKINKYKLSKEDAKSIYKTLIIFILIKLFVFVGSATIELGFILPMIMIGLEKE